MICTTALIATWLSPSFAQRSGRATSRLRALALLEVANGRARLVPIAIKVGDKYYDAGLYRADPRPMALDAGIVYEAEKGGDSIGLFTISNAQKMNGVWVGLGQWRPNNAPEPEKKQAAPASPSEDDDAPPVLRKSRPTPQEGSSAPTPVPSENKPAASDTKADATPHAAKPEDRTHTPTADSDEDPARPILRRGKPASREANDELPPTILEKPGAARAIPTTASAAGKASPSGQLDILTAISDAAGPAPRPYVMQLNAAERARHEQNARKLAYESIRKFASIRPQHKPALAGELADVHFQVYDAHYNNEPDLVLSASLPELLPPAAKSEFRYFVTVVAREDMYGETHQLLASVTDSTHLDAYPRLELIDVVDAEGSGSGQLLLRQVSDRGFSYALYRIGMDKLWLLFEGAGSSF